MGNTRVTLVAETTVMSEDPNAKEPNLNTNREARTQKRERLSSQGPYDVTSFRNVAAIGSRATMRMG
jgi:hypothetical protein